MKDYLLRHLTMGKYQETDASGRVYHSRSGWQDFLIGDGIVFSHRTNDYDEEGFPEHLHSHDYCELLFWEGGEVQYLCGDRIVTPREGLVVMLPSGKSHTARLCAPSVYRRFVLYLKPSAFDFGGQSSELVQALFSEQKSFSFALGTQARDEVRKRLYRIEKLLTTEKDASLLAYAEVVLLLKLLQNERDAALTELAEESLPIQVRELRTFLDENYATVSSVEELAERFYYSREYVTRLFSAYFNLSPRKYVELLRIREACQRIERGEKITEVCYAVGYRSMSAFSASFRRVMGTSPTEYRKK